MPSKKDTLICWVRSIAAKLFVLPKQTDHMDIFGSDCGCSTEHGEPRVLSDQIKWSGYARHLDSKLGAYGPKTGVPKSSSAFSVALFGGAI